MRHRMYALHAARPLRAATRPSSSALLLISRSSLFLLLISYLFCGACKPRGRALRALQAGTLCSPPWGRSRGRFALWLPGPAGRWRRREEEAGAAATRHAPTTFRLIKKVVFLSSLSFHHNGAARQHCCAALARTRPGLRGLRRRRRLADRGDRGSSYCCCLLLDGAGVVRAGRPRGRGGAGRGCGKGHRALLSAWVIKCRRLAAFLVPCSSAGLAGAKTPRSAPLDAPPPSTPTPPPPDPHHCFRELVRYACKCCSNSFAMIGAPVRDVAREEIGCLFGLQVGVGAFV
ncbi:hypothetical protein L1887_52093 [Cichorium endivia]|nr:hypothetical protein L1887_52093 [Cichorium endivia]